ncbi:unnamed protein product [Rangifer tarandus platyrhynchus]|uniref:Uncharacterized protein n=1 Tax=Rangifer tarandus platyrhynchus TaxID=3082113 RepID=A0AC59YMD5_RANTA
MRWAQRWDGGDGAAGPRRHTPSRRSAVGLRDQCRHFQQFSCFALLVPRVSLDAVRGACDLAICLLFENLSLVVTMATSKVTVGQTGIMSCLNFL